MQIAATGKREKNMKREKIIKIYGQLIGNLWYGGEGSKEFEYYLEKDQGYDEYEKRYIIPDNVIIYNKLYDVYNQITRDGDFNGGAKIIAAVIEVTEWKDEHRARVYVYELTGKIDGNSKYFVKEKE